MNPTAKQLNKIIKERLRVVNAIISDVKDKPGKKERDMYERMCLERCALSKIKQVIFDYYDRYQL